jgi:hypothetical protein
MIRREQLSIDTPAKDGMAAGKVVVRVDYSDFGRELDLRLPPARRHRSTPRRRSPGC